MATQDLQTFVRERMLAFDSTVDVSPGSPFDQAVVQPLVQRLGQDPFTVDLATFLHDRLEQAYPEMATEEGDAITDLLVKPARLLWDPIVREIGRIKNAQSLQNPDQLTSEEAEALLANIFSERNRGNTARGACRMFFQQPRDIAVSPANFFTSRSGLHFFPDGVQAISISEMLLNLSGGLYYFDVNVVAEAAGTDYNIDAGEVVSVANVEATVRVTNLRRFRDGTSDEDTRTFIDRSEQELTERSMVTQRGIGARLGKAFPEISRLGLVGFGDPEMQRDVLEGGGLGGLVAAGTHAAAVQDGDNQPLTRRITIDAPDVVDFEVLIGPSTVTPTGYVVSLVGAFSVEPVGRDLVVRRVIDSTTLELEDQVINPSASGVTWSLRKRTLTLSGIPGGILFPNSANGELTIPDDQVHVGGLFDIHARGASSETATMSLLAVSDNTPAASGTQLQFSASDQVSLDDFVLGTDYAIGDALYQSFADARTYGYTLEVQEGPNAGNYRVVASFQILGGAPILTVDSAPGVATGPYRWRLVDTIQLDLVEPRDIRVEGNDLATVQNTTSITTSGGTDFLALGVSVDDTLRINNGSDAGDYLIKGLPFYNELTVDRPVTASASNLSYSVFRVSGDGIERPLVRVSGLELLDSSAQPVGTKVPYGKPVDAQSRAFQNPGRGAKVNVTDAQLGIVSSSGASFAVNGQTLVFTFPNPVDGLPTVSVTFSGTLSATAVAAAINAQVEATIGPGYRLAGVLDGGLRVGVIPIASIVVVASGTARTTLFGSAGVFTTADVRSAVVDATGWPAITPAINQDNLDALNVLDGSQIGFYGGLHVTAEALVVGNPLAADYQPSVSFAPEVGRHVQVGARSLGSARLYFLDPTSIEVDGASRFSVELADGSVVRYFPDPTVERIKLPALPSTVLPKDGSSTQGAATFTSSGSNFVLSGIREGDVLDISYVPVTGTVTLADPVTTLSSKKIIISVAGGLDQTITFVTDLTGSDVSRAGVVDQINDAVGQRIAQLNANALEFEADVSIIVRKTGDANTLFGFSTTVDSSNAAAHQGRYVIEGLTPTTLTVSPVFPVSSPGTEAREAFQVVRVGAQRCCTAEMQNNRAEAGLYYFDVELVSEGTGDLWNIPAALQLSVEGYRADGYWLESLDSNLTFSPVELVTLNLSRSILDAGVSDDPQNAIQLTGQNIEVSYDRSTLVADIQNFSLSDTERVVCANPLARHLVPHYVRFDFNYQGGSAADIVVRDVESYINGLFPADRLESSDLQNIAYRRGATSVQNPLDLLAVVHYPDRSVWIQRSQDSLNTGRLAAFIPDVLNVNRRTGG